MAVFLGVQLGIILFFLIGPVFVLIMEETIKSGKMSAFRLAAGMWSGDFIYAVITILSISTLLPSLEDIDIRWGYILALGLIGIGIQSIRHRGENLFNQKISAPKTKGLFWKGFLINIFNPFVITFWAAIATQIKDKDNHFVLLFYSSLFATVILGDIFKIFSAHFIIKKINTSRLSFVRACIGVLLVTFGIIMIFRITYKWLQI